MKPTILLKCPKCNLQVETPRCDFDPANALSMEMACENCSDGGFELVDYFDKDGNWMTGDLREREA